MNLSTLHSTLEEQALSALSDRIEALKLGGCNNHRIALIGDELSEAEFAHLEKSGTGYVFEEAILVGSYKWKIGCNHNSKGLQK